MKAGHVKSLACGYLCLHSFAQSYDPDSQARLLAIRARPWAVSQTKEQQISSLIVHDI